MTTLVVRLAAGSRPGALDYVRLDASGRIVDAGTAQAALLPRTQRLVAVWPTESLSLLSLQLPAVPAARLQAALVGTLEERVLGDIAQQHLAAGPREPDGALRWACCTPLNDLRQALGALAAAGFEPDAVVPEPALLEPGQACLQRDTAGLRLVWRDGTGEAAWLHWSPGAPQPELPSAVRECLCEADLRDTARAWLGEATTLQDCAAQALLARAARSDWNLLQFELAPQAAAQRLLRVAREQWRTPVWRRNAWLGAALAVTLVAGLNLQAWRLRANRAQLQDALETRAAEALPGVPALLDPQVQIHHALEQARERVGAPAAGGIEALMGAAAMALPGDAVVKSLDFTPGRLSLEVGATAAAAAAARCAPLGLQCTSTGKTLQVEARGA